MGRHGSQRAPLVASASKSAEVAQGSRSLEPTTAVLHMRRDIDKLYRIELSTFGVETASFRSVIGGRIAVNDWC